MDTGGRSDIGERSIDAELAGLAKDEPILLEAGCKINLGLKILGQREDGYHLIDSIFYPLKAPCDKLYMARAREEGIRVLTDCRGVDPEKNTLTKAWKVFAETTGFAQALVVRLEKNIPWGAGLGGGSADAACVLRHMALLAKEAGRPVSEEALLSMAARVGADVPFFLRNVPMRVQGIGEILTEVDLCLEGFFLVLVMPCVSVQTPWAYKAYDESRARKGTKGAKVGLSGQLREKEQSLLEALTVMTKVRKESLPIDSPLELANDLEPVVFKRYPALGDIKRTLLAHGACAASMSGSGSSVFALYDDEAKARAAAASMEWPVQLSSLAGM